ncbi:hypothetical protein GCM10010145_65070 [Streptomyces ruber]|uniref:Uncharacterized protein n=2 Tax=Streptomyces TaxID=1883 RepID=A0A918BRB0_9ACTN|nr:hypothetical protein GCM10010145_65070 [Streptomyces ruber]
MGNTGNTGHAGSVDNAVQGGSIGDKRYATLRPCAASPTATARRAPAGQHGPAAGEGTR